MAQYTNVGGVARCVTKRYENIGGVGRNIVKAYENVNGVARKFFGHLVVYDAETGINLLGTLSKAAYYGDDTKQTVEVTSSGIVLNAVSDGGLAVVSSNTFDLSRYSKMGFIMEVYSNAPTDTFDVLIGYDNDGTMDTIWEIGKKFFLEPQSGENSYDTTKDIGSNPPSSTHVAIATNNGYMSGYITKTTIKKIWFE